MNIDEITQGIYRDWGDQLAKKKNSGGKNTVKNAVKN